ncbi:MAG: UvrD-helicase domain-containing protein, partial [bacterium]|nr:UvrD-helicase domain-containing protein [bacterium]
MSHLLENLNEEQKSAVIHRSGPLMIVAGAGTGKTTVITRRIAWLIEEGLAKPHEILALTFTEKAASEMEERVDKLLPIGMIDVFIATFHGFCDRLLREYALDIGLSPNYRLLTEMDSLHLLRKYEERFAFNLYKPRSRPSSFYKSFLNYISKIKDFAQKPQELLEALRAETLFPDEAERELHEKERELLEAFQTFENILLEEAAMDFGNLISTMIELLKTRPSVRKELQNRFKYILVDEFQDTNPAQYELVKLLVDEEQNITVVGDDDQSIYAFRGASLQNILTFRADFPSSRQIVLTMNYRSKQEVLDHSYTLISQNNPHRLEAREHLSKELFAHNKTGGHVLHHHFATEEDEVEFTLRTILEKKHDGGQWGDMAILVRANAHAKAFVDGCERTGIPYKFHALEGLYTEPTVLDTLAWLHVIHQPHESTYLYRVLRMHTEIDPDV